MCTPITITLGPLSISWDAQPGTEHPVVLSHTGGVVRLTQAQAAAAGDLLRSFAAAPPPGVIKVATGVIPPRFAQEFSLSLEEPDEEPSNRDPADEHPGEPSASFDGEHYRIEAIESEWPGDCAAIAQRHGLGTAACPAGGR